MNKARIKELFHELKEYKNKYNEVDKSFGDLSQKHASLKVWNQSLDTVLFIEIESEQIYSSVHTFSCLAQICSISKIEFLPGNNEHQHKPTQ